jgi:hypothetical protein
MLTARTAFAQPAGAAPPPPPPPAAPEPAAPPAPPPAVAPAPPLPGALGTGAVAKATFKPGVLLQTWGYYQNREVSSDSFRIRRAELTAKGDLIPKLFSYAFMFDTARLLEPSDVKVGTPPVTVRQTAGGAILQDVFVTFNSSVADVSMGQFKIPVGWESYNSTGKTLFPERSIVSLQFADKRDIGFRIAKTFEKFGYSAGLFNGNGIDTTDNDKAKDGALRLEAYPIKGLTVAGVAYATLWDATELGARRRFEADVRFERGPFLFQSEYIYARDRKAAPGFLNTLVKGQGFYGAVAVRVWEGLQLAGRFSFVDPDTSSAVDKDHTKAYEGQIAYYLREHEVKFQLAYAHFDAATVTKDTLKDQLTFASQLWY